MTTPKVPALLVRSPQVQQREPGKASGGRRRRPPAPLLRAKHGCKAEPRQQPAGARGSAPQERFHLPFHRRDAAVAPAQGVKALVCAAPAVCLLLCPCWAQALTGQARFSAVK